MTFWARMGLFLCVLSNLIKMWSNLNLCFCAAIADISWLMLGSIWMRLFWSALSFVVLLFLAVLINSLVVSERSVETIVKRYSLSGSSFSFISGKYALRSSTSLTSGQIFTMLNSLYFGTMMYFYFTSLQHLKN